MATNDASANAAAAADPEPEPELVDWWVWGVRKVAGVVAELLMVSRGLIVLLALVKLGIWYFTRDISELYRAGAGVVGFVAAWGTAIVLGRFAWSRESPNPERWLAQRQRR